MTNFKKSALVAALLVAGAAQAGTITQFTPIALSKQATNALTINGNNFFVDPGVAYQVGTEITVTFSAGELTVAPSAATYAADTTTAVPAAVWTRVSQTATSATFRLSGQAVLATEFVRIGGYQFTTSSVLAGTTNATVVVKADTGVAIDAAGTGDKLTRAVVLVGDEYSAEVTTELDRKIDLAEKRLKFVSTTAPLDNTNKVKLVVTSTDTNSVTYKNDSNVDTQAAFSATTTVGTVVHTVTGDFSWVADSNSTTTGIQPATGTFTYSAGCSQTSITAAELKFTCTGVDGADTANSVEFDISKGGSELKDGSYTVTSVQNFTGPTGSVTTLNAADAGTWSNNGTTKALDYMPFGAETSQIIYVTNLTSQVGKIYVTATLEDGTKLLTGQYLADTIANGITPLAAKLEAALAGKAVAGKKVALSFDIESSSATVYGAYKVGSDRALVVTR